MVSIGNPIQRLLVTPRLLPRESLEGYLLRLVEKNGYMSPAWLKRQIGATRLYDTPQKHRERLADVIGVEEPALARVTPIRSLSQQGMIRLGGQMIPRSAVETQGARFCPKCLARDGYYKLTWQLRPVIVCPEHGCYLVENCPDCNEPIRWNRGKVTQCKCGSDLKSTPVVPADQQSRDLSSDVETMFLQLQKERDIKVLPREFAVLETGPLLHELILLMAYVSGKGRGKGAQLASRIASDARMEAYARTAGMLANWPHSFFELLDELCLAAGEKKTGTGLAKEFGSFYPAVSQKGDQESRPSPVRAAFERYVETSWAGGFISRKNTRLSFDSGRQLRHLTLSRAAKILGYHPSILKRDIASGRLNICEKPSGSRTLRLIDRDELLRYRAYREGMIGLEAATAQLGLSSGQAVLQLVRSGLLKALRGPKIDGHTAWMFQNDEIARFLNSVYSCAPEKPSVFNVSSFFYATRRASFRGKSVADVVQAILSGDLKVSGRREKFDGFRGLLIDSSSLLWFVGEATRNCDWGVTIQKAARLMGLNEEATRELVRLGHLRIRRDGELRALVAYAAIEDFKKTYVSASEIAVRLKTSTRCAVFKLKEFGIEAATGPAIDGGRQYFFRRAELKANPETRKLL